MPLNTSIKKWYTGWFYVRRDAAATKCDVDQVPVSNKSWSATPGSSDMVLVEELVSLMADIKINGVAVAWN